MSLTVCVIIVCAFVFSVDLSANSFYVSTNGNDSNSGDANAPFRTIRSGLSHLNAGDTLIIRGGTYAESIPYFTIPSGIDASRHTTVQGAPGEKVILNGLGPNFDVIEIANRSYITLDNLTVEGAPNTGIRLGEGGGWEVSYITVKNVIAKNNGTGIYTSGTAGLNHHLLLQRVTISDSRGHGIYFTGADSIIEDSDIYESFGHGIHLYGATLFDAASRNTIRNNRIHRNGSFGLMLSSGWNNIAYNNLIYANGWRTPSGGFRFYDGALNNQFLNNSVYGNSGPGIWIQSGVGSIVTNNISYGNSLDRIVDDGLASAISYNLTTDPGFVDANGGNFHLTAGSKAINAGTFLTSVLATDMEGTSRPQNGNFDVGAYEYR
jgi:parallel beta-helix repeat protein